jgi:hypothetical protein
MAKPGSEPSRYTGVRKAWRCIAAAIGIGLTSLPLVIIGARMRCESPRFDDWLASQLAGFHGSGPALGVAVGAWWVFISVCWVVGLVLFSVSLMLVASLPFGLHRSRWLSITSSAVFGAACVWVAVACLVEAAGNVKWGFAVLACGECLTAAALLLGTSAVVRMCLSERPSAD